MRANDLIWISGRQVWRQYRKNIGVAMAIIMGTAGLMVIITMGHSIENNISGDLEIIGNATRLRVIFKHDPTDPNPIDNREFSPKTIEGIKKIPGIYGVSGSVFKGAYVKIIHQNSINHFPMIGVDETFWKVNNSVAQTGTLFSQDDIQQRKAVCVLGQRTAHELFGHLNVTGQFVSIENNLFEVVGIIDNISVPDKRRYIFLPLTTAQDRLKLISPINRLYIRCISWDDIEQVEKALPAVMKRYQPTDKIEILYTKEVLARVKTITFAIKIFVQLALLATFLLGGIGIWNIMMMSVSSRTREIGLKKAIGAEDHDILFQFLTESLMLSFSATIIGFILGSAGVNITASLIGTSPPRDLFWISTVIGFTFSIILGIVAGIAPAIKASRMEVVTALRYE